MTLLARNVESAPANEESSTTLARVDVIGLPFNSGVFSRASVRIVCVQAPTLRGYHLRTPFDPFYIAYREDVAEDLRTLARLWSGREPRML